MLTGDEYTGNGIATAPRDTSGPRDLRGLGYDLYLWSPEHPCYTLPLTLLTGGEHMS